MTGIKYRALQRHRYKSTDYGEENLTVNQNGNFSDNLVHCFRRAGNDRWHMHRRSLKVT
jgi:hypothetical protein